LREKEDKEQRQAKMTTTKGRELKINEMATQEITNNNIRTWNSKKVTTTNNTTKPRDSRKEITSNTIYWTRMIE
jgi:hypothetical protein